MCLRVLTLLMYVLVTQSAGAACPVEIIARQAVKGTDWEGLALMEACGFWGGAFGNEQIYLVNIKQQAKVLIAKSNNTWSTELSSPEPGMIIISVPNLSDVVEINTPIPGVEVRFQYQPVNNPRIREGYKEWLSAPALTKNRDWWCETILPTIPQPARSEMNEYNGRFLGSGHKGNYCD